MKIIQYFLFILMIGTGLTMANENQHQVRYQLQFKANHIHCLIRVNGIYVYDTYDSVGNTDPIQLSFGHGITEFLNQGKNELLVEATSFVEFIPKSEISNSYCEVSIIAMVDNPETGGVDQKIVSNIRYTYQPKPKDSEAIFPYLLSIDESNKDLDKILSSNFIVLEQALPYPKKKGQYIQQTLATRTFDVNHTQPFSWVNRSTPFEDTPENRQKLWEKYNEIRTAIENKDKKAIRKLVEPGVTDMAKFYGDTPDNHFEFSFDVIDFFFNLNRNIYMAEPLTLDDYDLEIYAGGKLFRLNEKNYTLVSPLQWKNPMTKVTERYNPIFTYIDGKIVMAWF